MQEKFQGSNPEISKIMIKKRFSKTFLKSVTKAYDIKASYTYLLIV